MSITATFPALDWHCPFAADGVKVNAVPRTDENGRQLKALLDYLLDGDVDAKDIYDALGVSSSTYYRRIKEQDYPDAEELRRVADRFGLSYPDLQVRFGLMSHQEVRGYFESAGVGRGYRGNAATCGRPKLSELKPRQDAPPLIEFAGTTQRKGNDGWLSQHS